jgi:hypothetical protein
METQKREIEAAVGENRPDRKTTYAAPKLVEWGALAELTGGTHGGAQDVGGLTGTETMF